MQHFLSFMNELARHNSASLVERSYEN